MIISDETKAVGQGFVLGHAVRFRGHVLGPAWGLGLIIVNDGLFNLDIDVLWSATGGRDKSVAARKVQKETHQANAIGTDFDTDQMEGHHQSV